MDAQDHLVFVVDDDSRVRESVEDLLLAAGHAVATFGSVAAFVARGCSARAECLVLDLELPDASGLELQARLTGRDYLPIVFVTGYADVPSSVRAMKAGAVDFLTKPFKPPQLLAAIDCALHACREHRREAAALDNVRRRYASLTPREREVLPLVVHGLLNKQAAAHLGISEVTLQIHRSNIMRKMDARSLSELVRLSIKLGVPVEAEIAAIVRRSAACERASSAPAVPQAAAPAPDRRLGRLAAGVYR